MSDQMIILAFLGTTEMLLIGGAAVLLIFGGKRIPDLARSVGRSIVEFKAGMKDEPGESEKPSEPQRPAGESESQ